MPLYRVYYQQTASTSVEVEADSPEEAEDNGYDKLPGSLCHQCASEYDMSGDWEPEVDREGNSTAELIGGRA